MKSEVIVFIICIYAPVASMRSERYEPSGSVLGTHSIDLTTVHRVRNRRECSSMCLMEECAGFGVHNVDKNTYLCHLEVCPSRLPKDIKWDVFHSTVHGVGGVKCELVLLVTDNSVNFDRPWAKYKAGFGDPATNYWIGLDALHNLTTSNDYGMYITVTDWENTTLWAYYSSFSVGPESDNYRLNVSGYDNSSTAGDSLTSTSGHDGMEFTTRDRDNDIRDTKNCADTRNGGWWYNDCMYSKLTGLVMSGEHFEGIIWKSAPGYNNLYSFKMSTMQLTIN